MKILIDANIVLSAYIFGSTRIKLVLETIIREHHAIVPYQVVEECFRVAERKRPDCLDQLGLFFGNADIHFAFPPDQVEVASYQIRDVTDQPILELAIVNDADIIISGDRDFHALDVDRPRIMTATQFREEFMIDNE